jgi:hypothetical protein
MKQSNIETIDGQRGEWRTVTKASEVKVGQRVRFWSGTVRWGFTEDKSSGVHKVSHFKDGEAYLSDPEEKLFKKFWDGIQAFFPLPDKPKRKVAKIWFIDCNPDSGIFFAQIIIGRFMATIDGYSSRKSALRGARRFCKAIGYEMEVVK